MKKIIFILSLFSTFQLNCSCNRNSYLKIPKESIVYSKNDSILKNTSLEEHIATNGKYVLIFSIAGCLVCDEELVIWKKIINRNPKINAISIVNCEYPKVCLIHALKEKRLIPTIIYKNYDMIIENNLSEELRYIIIDNNLKILQKSKIINEKKILSALRK